MGSPGIRDSTPYNSFSSDSCQPVTNQKRETEEITNETVQNIVFTKYKTQSDTQNREERDETQQRISNKDMENIKSLLRKKRKKIEQTNWNKSTPNLIFPDKSMNIRSKPLRSSSSQHKIEHEDTSPSIPIKQDWLYDQNIVWKSQTRKENYVIRTFRPTVL